MGAELYPEILMRQAEQAIEDLSEYGCELHEAQSLAQDLLSRTGLASSAWDKLRLRVEGNARVLARLQGICLAGVQDHQKLCEQLETVMAVSGGKPLIEDELTGIITEMEKNIAMGEGKLSSLRMRMSSLEPSVSVEDQAELEHLGQSAAMYRSLIRASRESLEEASAKRAVLYEFLQETGSLFQVPMENCLQLSYVMMGNAGAEWRGKADGLIAMAIDGVFDGKSLPGEGSDEAFLRALSEGRYEDAFRINPAGLSPQSGLIFALFAHDLLMQGGTGENVTGFGALQDIDEVGDGRYGCGGKERGLEEWINAIIATDEYRSAYGAPEQGTAAYGPRYLSILRSGTSALIDMETARVLCGELEMTETQKREFHLLVEENSLWGALEETVCSLEGLELCLEKKPLAQPGETFARLTDTSGQEITVELSNAALHGTTIRNLQYIPGTGFALDAVYVLAFPKDPSRPLVGDNIYVRSALEETPLHIRTAVNDHFSQIAAEDYERDLTKLKKKQQNLGRDYAMKALLNMAKTLLPSGAPVISLVQSISSGSRSGVVTGVENILEKTGAIGKEDKKITSPAAKNAGMILDYYKELASLTKQIHEKQTYGKIMAYGATNSYEASCAGGKTKLRAVTKAGFYNLHALENVRILHKEGICGLWKRADMDVLTAENVRARINGSLDPSLDPETASAVQTILYGISTDSSDALPGEPERRKLQSFDGETLLQAFLEIEYAYDSAYAGEVKPLGENVETASWLGR